MPDSPMAPRLVTERPISLLGVLMPGHPNAYPVMGPVQRAMSQVDLNRSLLYAWRRTV